MVKVVTGLRRSGKSYLLFELFRTHLINNGVKPENIISLALDSLENKPLRNVYALYDRIVGSISDREEYYILLDEVQMAEGFDDLLNSLLRRKNLDIYVQGAIRKCCPPT